jgi:hypothetical protein
MLESESIEETDKVELQVFAPAPMALAKHTNSFCSIIPVPLYNFFVPTNCRAG